jgi:hypothetical protein
VQRFAPEKCLAGGRVSRHVPFCRAAALEYALNVAQRVTMGTLQRRSKNRVSRENVARLRRALDTGNGHVAVFGETPGEAAAFVDAFLAHDMRYQVARVSVRRPQATENTLVTARPGGVTAVIVDDAESATAAQLERLREICDERVNTVDRVRLVLVGAAELEATLAENEARALASRIGVRLRISPGATARDLFAPRPKPARRWPFVASALAGVAALACMAYTDVPVTPPTGIAYAIADRAVELRDRAVALIDEELREVFRQDAATRSNAETPGVGARAPAAVVPLRGTGDAVPGGTSGPGATPSAPVPPATPPPAAMIPSSPYSPPVLTVARVVESGVASDPISEEVHEGGATARTSIGRGVLATVVSLFVPAGIGERVIASGGALIESVLMAAELLAADDGHATRPVQLGWFERPRPAFELKSELTPHFDRVAVARFDPPAGPFFSVRVFDAGASVPSATARADQTLAATATR